MKLKIRSLILLISFTTLATTGCGENAKVDELIPEESIDTIAPPNPPEPPREDAKELPPTIEDLKTLPDGRPLSAIKVRGSSLSLAYGTGYSFSNGKRQEYEKLKSQSMNDPSHKVQWAFMDLDSGELLAHSASAHLKIFGASSSKIYVAAALLDKEKGQLSNTQLQRMADMLVVSSNSAWKSLQKDIGDGSADLGRERNYNFTQKMGYPLTRGWQGYWGSVHGNELVPIETVQTLYDIYHNNFEGAQWLWTVMHACRTGASRGRKYIPQSIVVGGKTGTYDGPTENPQTGEQYKVRIRNHVLIFKVDGRQFGLAVLANSGSSESAALLAGGLLREYSSLGFTE